jgi:hypothetical protein
VDWRVSCSLLPPLQLSTELRRSEPYVGRRLLVSKIPEIVDREANSREWERDREAWNLPRAPREVDAASLIQGLPRHLPELDRDELGEASDTRDER